ncbi:hypothetical protein [Bradyrhizobium oligotrophicum]|uniref:hypothetical protein n=1 Tax=Bradyrhizobium oligotrophicum TaxID=44255 RepID=UPI00034C149C|nr:hypothetical protein [Bradyrhizobium oligotrophicum]
MKIAHLIAVVDPSGRRLLVDRNTGALPEIRAPAVASGEVAEFIALVQRQLRLPVYMLRCLRRHTDPRGRDTRSQIHLLEAAGPLERASRAYRIIDRADITPFAVSPRGELFDLGHAMRPRAGNRPWWKAGFAAAAVRWLEQTADRLGAGRVLRVEQLRSWEIAWLARVTAERATWYFKCSPAPLNVEADVIDLLMRIAPDHVPHLVARYRAGSGFLMDAYSEPTLEARRAPSAWIEAAAQFGRLQLDASGAVDRFIARGIPPLDLTDIEADIGALRDEPMRVTRTLAGLSDHHLQRLHHAWPRLSGLIAELNVANLPVSIDHGDLWAPNILSGKNNARFLDWSDATIGCPFFSTLPLLMAEGIAVPMSRDPRLRNHMRDAYLEPWQQRLGRGVALQAWKMAQPIAALHMASIYLRRILPLVDTELEIYRTLGWFVRLALRQRMF